MRISAVPARDLDAALLAKWRSLQMTIPTFANPYFSPHFTMAVASLRDDVFVGILEDGGQPVGFFPFQRSWGGIGHPVGGPFSSYQGVVARPEVEWNVPDLMRGCGLSVLEFTCMLVSQSQFSPYHKVMTESLIMDISEGYEAYEKKRIEMGGSQLKRTYRNMRKLEREHPGYRFVRHEASPAALRQMITWKTQQCHALGTPDIFGNNWSPGLLERVHATHLEDFGGILSALYVDDRMIAAEIDIQSPTVWHRWICAYDVEFARFSPGVILGIEMAKVAATEGVRHLDIGKEATFYKEHFMTSEVKIAEGYVEVPSPVTAARKARRNLESWVRASPFVEVARIPGRWLTKLERSRRFR